MQLTDAEIREILRRKKLEKKRRQQRRRRMTIIAILLIIVLIFILIKVLGNPGSGDKQDGGSAAAPGEIRGIIFIDPGHGGMDSGSDDDHDRYEKDDTLKLSLAVRGCLQGLGYKVEMSRTEDVMVDRIKRGEMANEAGAQLFVSIHRNKAATDGKGVEGFIPKSDTKESRLLGENIMHALGNAGFTERTIRAGTLNDASEDYDEISITNMPSVLIEVGFLSSEEDNKRFDNNLNKNAKAIAGAIDLTFMQLYDPERAAEYNKKLKEARAIADKAVNAVKKTAEATSEAAEYIPFVGGGIDPEA